MDFSNENRGIAQTGESYVRSSRPLKGVKGVVVISYNVFQVGVPTLDGRVASRSRKEQMNPDTSHALEGAKTVPPYNGKPHEDKRLSTTDGAPNEAIPV